MPVLTTVAQVKSQAGKEADVQKRLTELLEPVRGEQGCMSFDLHVFHDDPSLFVMIAVWKDYSAWEMHISSPRQQALLEESRTDQARELILSWQSYQVDKVA